LGIAALEEKILQQAVVTILNRIYEVDFQGFSYGFRPGRSPHQALDALTVELRLRMHEPVAVVGAWLRKVVNGYYRYHAVPGNIDQLSLFGQRGGFQPHAFCILILWFAFSLLIQGGSRMRRSARTDLCGGRSAMGVPTASLSSKARRGAFRVRFSECAQLRWPTTIAAESSNADRCLR